MNEILNTEYANDRSRIIFVFCNAILFFPSSFLCSFFSPLHVRFDKLFLVLQWLANSFGVGLKFNINIIALLKIENSRDSVFDLFGYSSFSSHFSHRARGFSLSFAGFSLFIRCAYEQNKRILYCRMKE